MSQPKHQETHKLHFFADRLLNACYRTLFRKPWLQSWQCVWQTFSDSAKDAVFDSSDDSAHGIPVRLPAQQRANSSCMCHCPISASGLEWFHFVWRLANRQPRPEPSRLHLGLSSGPYLTKACSRRQGAETSPSRNVTEFGQTVTDRAIDGRSQWLRASVLQTRHLIELV